MVEIILILKSNFNFRNSGIYDHNFMHEEDIRSGGRRADVDGEGTEARGRGREVAARTEERGEEGAGERGRWGAARRRWREGGSWARKRWRHTAPEGGRRKCCGRGRGRRAQHAGVRGRESQVLWRRAGEGRKRAGGGGR